MPIPKDLEEFLIAQAVEAPALLTDLTMEAVTIAEVFLVDLHHQYARQFHQAAAEVLTPVQDLQVAASIPAAVAQDLQVDSILVVAAQDLPVDLILAVAQDLQ